MCHTCCSTTEVVTDPLICPRCGSRTIVYAIDAAVYYRQRPDGERTTREADCPNLYDAMLEAECLDCTYREEHPSFSTWSAEPLPSTDAKLALEG